jgi:hypothetical protein
MHLIFGKDREVFVESNFKDSLELNLSKMNEINTRISWSGVYGLYLITLAMEE